MPATQQGAGGKNPGRVSRSEMLNKVGESRVNEINKELEESESKARVQFTPITDGKESDDDDRDLDAERAATGDDPGADGGNKAGAGGKDAGEGGDIYEFLGEDKLPRTKATIKVDGKEETVILGDLLRDVQKYRAADKRLEEAALAKRSAEEKAKKLIDDATAQAGTILKGAGKTGDENQSTDSGDKAEPSKVSDALQKSVAHLYEGDQEQAVQLLSNAIGDEVERRVKLAKAEGTTADPKAIAQHVRSELLWDKEIEQFSADHSDIVDDPYLLGMWQNALNSAAETSSTPKEAITKATEVVTTWLGKVSGRPSGDKVTTGEGDLQSRQAVKDSARDKAVQTSTSLRSGARTTPNKPQTPTDAVAEMKRARGQT
jgi:hypothetical protein